MKRRIEEDSEAISEEVSTVGESSKKNDEAQGKMKQQSSTSLAGKRCGDKQENESGEFFGTPKCKIRHEATIKKKKFRRDEWLKSNVKEEEKKRKTQKRLRKRSRSKETCEFSQEKEEKEINIRRKMKAESVDPASMDEADL